MLICATAVRDGWVEGLDGGDAAAPARPACAQRWHNAEDSHRLTMASPLPLEHATAVHVFCLYMECITVSCMEQVLVAPAWASEPSI